MKNIAKLSSLFVILIFSFCKKEDNPSLVKGLPRMEEVFQTFNDPKNGAIRLSSLKSMDAASVSGQKNLREVYGKFWSEDNKTLIHGTLSIDDYLLNPKSSGVYQSESMLNNPALESLFGKTVDFVVEDDDVNLPRVLQSSLYVPADITVSSPLKTSYNQVLPANTEIVWNPDTINKEGVYILIEFDPEDDDNAAFNTNENEYTYNLIQTDDDGSFSLSANDFSDMPAGAKIFLWVSRGNYNLVDGADGINKYALSSYSTAFDTFILGE